jgi:hypothetical protein
MTMLTEMHPESKVWIYAANRILTETETAEIQGAGNEFALNWTAHQQQLKAEFRILHGVFLVFTVDETQAEISGCGIDKSVHFMQDIDKKYNLDIFNRMRVELWQNNVVILTNKQNLSVMWQEGAVNEQTLLFNKLVTTKKQFDESFLIPLSQSWVFPSLTVFSNP